MSRYGDTANGMVEAALEFLRICASENFHQLVVSLKSSNTRIMVQAYRLLVNRMTTEGMNYPLHLGVTEAGDGEDGRIKSAVGIGTLLADGIGDTVRVSLTEDPEAELPVARNIVHYFEGRKESTPINFVNEQVKNPFEYQKRDSQTIENIGGKNIPIVISDWVRDETYHQIDKSTRPDYYYITIPQENEQYPIENKYIVGLKDWITTYQSQTNFFPILSAGELILYGEKSEILNFVILSASDMSFGLIKALKRCKKTVAIIETFNLNGIAEQRSILYTFIDNNISLPVIINRNYCEEESVGFQIKSACDLSSLFIDGLGDGLWLRNVGNVDLLSIISTSFGILQASRVRTSKTEYISCPSCGRTLFDLQATTAKIKEKTKHLKHLKIGIMGCIVNGPGEMADADYGYVGAAAGKITLYKGKEVIKKNIKADNAVDELIQIIKQNGDWVDFN
jgi:(E)-4-hydroxy-3-methylbut-2-enyl-diphosphate synthase